MVWCRILRFGSYLLVSKEAVTKEFNLLSVVVYVDSIIMILQREIFPPLALSYLKNSISGWRCLSLPTRKLEVPAVLLVLEAVLLWRE